MSTCTSVFKVPPPVTSNSSQTSVAVVNSVGTEGVRVAPVDLGVQQPVSDLRHKDGHHPSTLG